MAISAAARLNHAPRENAPVTADRREEAVSQLEAVEYGLVIVAAAVAFGLLMVARARRRDHQECDELRTHVRRLGGPSDPST
jgi:hypothetical protein